MHSTCPFCFEVQLALLSNHASLITQVSPKRSRLDCQLIFEKAPFLHVELDLEGSLWQKSYVQGSELTKLSTSSPSQGTLDHQV